jgi:hypothetical protein
MSAELRLATRGRHADEEEVSTSGRLSSRSDPDAAPAKKVIKLSSFGPKLHAFFHIGVEYLKLAGMYVSDPIRELYF